MNHYAQVIEVIFNKQYNAEAIVLSLAKSHPALFLELSGNKSNQEPKIIDPEFEICRSVLRSLISEETKPHSLRSIVASVRHYRELTNSTLRDALDYVHGILFFAHSLGKLQWRQSDAPRGDAYHRAYDTFAKYSRQLMKEFA